VGGARAGLLALRATEQTERLRFRAPIAGPCPDRVREGPGRPSPGGVTKKWLLSMRSSPRACGRRDFGGMGAWGPPSAVGFRGRGGGWSARGAGCASLDACLVAITEPSRPSHGTRPEASGPVATRSDSGLCARAGGTSVRLRACPERGPHTCPACTRQVGGQLLDSRCLGLDDLRASQWRRDQWPRPVRYVHVDHGLYRNRRARLRGRGADEGDEHLDRVQSRVPVRPQLDDGAEGRYHARHGSQSILGFVDCAAQQRRLTRIIEAGGFEDLQTVIDWRWRGRERRR